MSDYTEAYGIQESDFESLEMFDEARLGFRPAKKVTVAGAGLTTATLQTPRGPARLNLPTAMPTLAQFRALEAVINSQSQRMNTVQAELVRVRRELAARRGDQGLSSSSMLLPLLMQKKVRDDLNTHTHPNNNAPPAFPGGGSSSGLSSLLPLLLLAPGALGGAPATSTSTPQGQDSIPPLLFALLFMDL